MFASSDDFHFKSVKFGMISQSIGIDIKPRKRIAFDIIITHSVFKLAIIFSIIWWLSDKESTCQAGYAGSIPGSGRSSGEGNLLDHELLGTGGG